MGLITIKKARYMAGKRSDIKRYDTRVMQKMKFKRLLIWTAVGALIGISLNGKNIAENGVEGTVYWGLGFAGLYIMLAVILAIFTDVEYELIYEDGIRKNSPFFIEIFLGKVFIPYQEIEKIGYGAATFSVPFILNPLPFPAKEKKSNFIVLTLKDSDKIYTFLEVEYIKTKKLDFYQKIIEVLREKCSHAPWVEMEWPDWRRKPTFKASPQPTQPFQQEALQSTQPLGHPCTYCAKPLSYLPQYARWYCYNCQAWF